MNRYPQPLPGQYTTNPEMAEEIAQNPVFSTVANEVAHERELQAMRYFYIYTLSGEVTGLQSTIYSITIEQGTDFICKFMTASCFSYDAADDTDFPIPNSAGVASWAGRGLSAKITDSRAGRELTSGYVPFELFSTPGYGLSFQNLFPLKYFFYRNSKVTFDVRNRDNADRTHQFEIALIGFKVQTPN